MLSYSTDTYSCGATTVLWVRDSLTIQKLIRHHLKKKKNTLYKRHNGLSLIYYSEFNFIIVLISTSKKLKKINGWVFYEKPYGGNNEVDYIFYVEVRANNVASFSFTPHSLPISPSHHSYLELIRLKSYHFVMITLKNKLRKNFYIACIIQNLIFMMKQHVYFLRNLYAEWSYMKLLMLESAYMHRRP